MLYDAPTAVSGVNSSDTSAVDQSTDTSQGSASSILSSSLSVPPTMPCEHCGDPYPQHIHLHEGKFFMHICSQVYLDMVGVYFSQKAS